MLAGYRCVKHPGEGFGIHHVMDLLVLDAATAGCIAIAIAVWNRKPTVRQPARPVIFAVARSIRDLRRRHRRIARSIVEIANECCKRHPDGSFEAFTARETVRSYLPETLAAYLAVPRAFRRVRRGDRPSADDELSRQLRILHDGLERIREADAEIGISRMAGNGAFLNERFASANPGQLSDRRSVLGELVNVLETALRRN